MQFGWQFPATRSRNLSKVRASAGTPETPPASRTASTACEVIPSRAIRRQLKDLVQWFERSTGVPVGEDFCVASAPPHRIALRSHGCDWDVPTGCPAHRIAQAALARFQARNRPGARSSQLFVSPSGIVFTQEP